MRNTSSRVRIAIAVAVLGLIGVAIGCGDNSNPVRPTSVSAEQTAEASAAPATPQSSADVNFIAQASASHLTPADLTSRGWTCFEPIPNRIVCSNPQQGLPPFGNPPPADRPATFTFLIFDDTNRFVGTEVLLRTDLYKGQRCESTDGPYDFVPAIGYYECVHTTGH